MHKKPLATKKEVMNALYPYFANDKDMALLVGDMGFSVLDDYFAHFSARVFNVGIAEQAMLGMAAGMYLAGLKPVVYAQIPFLVMRAYEQIRYDICEHNMGVIMVGVGADNYFKDLGRSHCMDSDDIKLMEILPHLQILSTDKNGIEQALAQYFKHLVSPPPRYTLGVCNAIGQNIAHTRATGADSISLSISFGAEVACA